jgi:hypothetical protein
MRRSVVTCLVVGALLTGINQGDRLIGGELDWTMAWQIGLTFLVPLVVATVSGAMAIRRHNEEHGQSEERGAIEREPG